MSVKQAIKFKDPVRKLKPSQVMSNYKNIPADPEIYVRDSLMAKQPEVTLWDFIEDI